MLEFRCPHCSTPLRVRDATLLGRPFHCPDCRKSLIVQLANGVPQAQVALSESPLPLDIPRTTTSRTPAIIAAVAAGVLTAGVVGYVWSVTSEPATPVAVAPATPEVAHPVSSAPAGEPAEARPENAVERQLLGIHKLLFGYVERTGAYPGPPADANGFGWIAELAKTELSPVPVDFRQPWNSPGNDDFARRRFPAFENPALPRTPGNDGLPATHFVGVTGVGPQADRLAKSDPKAGIFGTGRVTQRADIKDGLANTILVAGVRDHLGSWARADRATIRGFEHPPYVNGPDGFGTGQPDGMYVLMADGSVRFVNASVEPVIVRRLAAMADGLSLDPAEPGDPLAMSAVAQVETMTKVPAPADDVPLTVELAADPPTFDIRERLAQPVVSYVLKTPTPLKTVLFELEELLGVPCDSSRLPPGSLDQVVTADVAEGTVGDLLTAVLKAAATSFEIQPDRIVLKPE